MSLGSKSRWKHLHAGVYIWVSESHHAQWGLEGNSEHAVLLLLTPALQCLEVLLQVLPTSPVVLIAGLTLILV